MGARGSAGGGKSGNASNDVSLITGGDEGLGRAAGACGKVIAVTGRGGATGAVRAGVIVAGWGAGVSTGCAGGSLLIAVEEAGFAVTFFVSPGTISAMLSFRTIANP